MDSIPQGTDASVLARLLEFGIDERMLSDRPVADGSADSFPDIEGYRIIAPLGQGGMGTVWRAEQLGTRRLVALKLLVSGGLNSARARARFEREVDLAARLQHPGIARVYDSGTARGVCYYSMELVDGQHLDEYVSRRGLGLRQILALMRDVCDAVQYAHQHGVIHRDLKPSNILVSEDGRPHVLDFGLARSVLPDPNLTMTREGEAAGTPAFMAPEQAAGQDDQIDTRTDVYGLGATLYRLLTGHPPHDTSGLRYVSMLRIVQGEVRRPRQLNPQIDAELESLLLKSLERHPASRYATASELGNDIQNYLQGDPLTARRITLTYLAGRRVRKHWAGLAITAAAVLAVLAGAIEAYLGNDRARADAVAAQKLTQAEKDRADQMRAVAERRLADSLLAGGDAMTQAARWVAAKQRYVEARNILRAQGLAPRSADLGLLNAYRVAPPPLGKFVGHAGAVAGAAFSPGGRLAASASWDGTVKLWDLRTAHCLRTLRGHTREVIAFSPDGARLITGSKDGSARIWDIATGTQLQRLPHPDVVFDVTFSNDGTRCATADWDGTARVWNSGSGRLICQSRGESSVAISPDDRRCLSANGWMNLWDASSGRAIRTFPSVSPANVVRHVAFSPDGTMALAGGDVLAGGDKNYGLYLRNLATEQINPSYAANRVLRAPAGF